MARGLPCSSTQLSKCITSKHDESHSPGAPITQAESCPFTQSLCAELVQLYFDYVHDQFHTLFHPPCFVEDVNRGHAPRILVYGMMALSARCVDAIVLASPPLTRSDFRTIPVSLQLIPVKEGRATPRSVSVCLTGQTFL